MNLFAIPAHAPFLDSVATAWLGQAGGDPERIARGLILLPTRRAARALAEAFLRVGNGRPLLLPRITAIGALDETPLALAGALRLPPAVTPARRLAVLARMILALDGAFGAPRFADRAWLLAGELARLLDEAQREGVDLAARLPDATGPDYAAHWQHSLKFLQIVTRAWPDWLADEGLTDPAARQVALLEAQADAWERQGPDDPVWIAGVTAGIPAVARLLRVTVRLPLGRVILPGVDRDLPQETALDPSHPQAGLRALLARLGARVGDARDWPEHATGAHREPVPQETPLPLFAAARERGISRTRRPATLWRAMLPASLLGHWREPKKSVAVDGLHRLDAADQQEEAVAIALILRDALRTPGKRAALVTPDRALAGRVAAELLRFGVVADDSAGENLAEAPPAVFLRLLATAIAEQLAPVPLLALLKHPFMSAGLPAAEARAAARAMELMCLRGPRPMEGIYGLRLALDKARDSAEKRSALRLLRCFEGAAEKLLRVAGAAVEAPRVLAAKLVVSPSELMAALIESAEALAATDTEPGAARLWAMEEGEALANLLAEVQAALPVVPDQPPTILPGLLDAVLEGAVVRSRRALRGRGGAEHPRVFIWGLLEARLQAVDLVVLGGLVEGVWPPATDPGPWMSRPMRKRVGLPSPEQRVGEAAHDFVMACCTAEQVVLSCPRRRDGAPAVPARWLTRLDAMLAGQGTALPPHQAAEWVRQLDQPRGPPITAPPPRPAPPVALRPRRLSVTEIETWQRDPYAIYAKHVLKLKRLDPPEQPTEPADFGTLVHEALHAFVQEARRVWPGDPAARLRHFMFARLQQRGLHPAVAAWWAPRLARMADWIAGIETERRRDAPARLGSELTGLWAVPGTEPFALAGRPDRIERRADGSLTILDYKTGRVPTLDEAESGLAPQLLLEAAMARGGAFGAHFQGEASELSYWKLTGAFQAGDVCTLFKGDAMKTAAAVAQATTCLAALIGRFGDPAMPYLAQPHPDRAPRFSDYAQLARVAEWAEAGED